jgi:hypothetical protein
MSSELLLDGRVVQLGGDHGDPGLQAAGIAAAVDLGPRPRPLVQGMLLVSAAELRLEDVASVGDDWAAAVTALVTAEQRRWQIVADGDVLLDIVDAGDAGLWSVGQDGDLSVWRPVSSEQLWSALLVALTREPLVTM